MFQTPLDPTFTMSPFFGLPATLPPFKPSELSHTLDQVERILETDNTEPTDFDQTIITIDPDPIHPEGRGMQVVDKISFADTYKDQAYADLIYSLLHQRNKRHLKDCYEPIAISYCAQDQQTSQNVNDFGPPIAKKIKIRNEITFTPPMVKSHQCEDLQEICQDVDEILSATFSSSVCGTAARFRSYQNEQWMERYQDICAYQKEHDHCLVSKKTNPLLAQWVKRQRYQLKLKSEGRHTTLTDERMMALESLGFIWDSNRAVWEERCNELCAFHQVHGHANVPSRHPENPQLAMWVKGQRRHYSLNKNGRRPSISKERTAKLNRLGFVWNARKITVKTR
jgi:uncharacterized protein CbrC (UPF0167 family)